jgi:hypothetical protein
VTPSDEVERFAGSLVSATVLFERFRHVLRTVEPEPENRSTFGHELRHLLILASTEVESAWKSILLANDYPPPKDDRFSTKDYCKLCGPMKLRDWRVALTLSPRYGTLAPFSDWDSEKPTASLSWYADYNSTKHDREVNLNKANLGNVVNAMAALHIVLAAQVGSERLSKAPYSLSDFRPVTEPQWPLEDEYVPPIRYSSLVVGCSTTMVPYPF